MSGISIINETTKMNSFTELNTAFASSNPTSSVDVTPLQTFGIVIGIFDIIVGSIGNFLTILAILTNKKLHKPFHIFIANLSVVDFMTATFMMPFNVTAYYRKTWPFGEDDFTCSLMAFFYYSCGYTSIACLIVITVNRFIGVVYHDLYHKLFTKKRIFFIIAFSWMFAPLFLFPFFFFSSGGFGWRSNLTLCVFLTGSYTQEELSYMKFTRVLFQFLPLLIMVVLYTKIFYTSKQSTKALRKYTTPSFTKKSSQHERKFAHLMKSSPSLSKMINMNGTEEKKTIGITEIQSVDKQLSEQKKHFDAVENVERRDKLYENEISGPATGFTNFNLSMGAKRFKTVQLDDCNMKMSRSAPSTPEPLRKSKLDNRKLSTTNSLRSLTKPHQSLYHRTTHLLTLDAKRLQNSKKYNATQRENKKRRKIDHRLLQISLAICVTFTVLFFPSFIISLIPGPLDPRIHMFGSVITWFNSCANPFIYCFLNSRMRKQYKLLLTKFWNFICRCGQLTTKR